MRDAGIEKEIRIAWKGPHAEGHSIFFTVDDAESKWASIIEGGATWAILNDNRPDDLDDQMGFWILEEGVVRRIRIDHNSVQTDGIAQLLRDIDSGKFDPIIVDCRCRGLQVCKTCCTPDDANESNKVVTWEDIMGTR